jgi:hypothetical protein
MKDLNEKQLRSWQPRRPSATLKRRLFGLAGDQELATARWLWSCLAPTMACALLALMALDREGIGLKPPTPIALIISSQNNAAFATGGAETKENHLAAITFDWTNDSIFRSSMRFTPSSNLTN